MIKNKLRKKILKIRKLKKTHNLKLDFKELIVLLKKEKLKKKNVGGYYPVNFEINSLQILQELEKKNFNISLPVIEKNNKMNFYRWSFNDPLVVNKYGIPEPASKKLNYPDIILVPLVAFDRSLNRLGYGGGFYDRYLKKISKKKKILKIGLASSFQMIKKVPVNVYDQKLDFVLTEKSMLK